MITYRTIDALQHERRSLAARERLGREVLRRRRRSRAPVADVVALPARRSGPQPWAAERSAS